MNAAALFSPGAPRWLRAWPVRPVWIACLAGWISCAAVVADATTSELIVYPAPAGARLNDAFSVKVRTPGGEWRDVPTYRIQVEAVDPVSGRHSQRDTSIAGFDFTGAVEVAVTSRRGAIGSARVRPLSCGIAPSVRGDTLTFKLDRPRKLSVEVDGDLFGNLQLFANTIETSRPSPDDPDVIYFGPGLHTLPKDVLRVPSGKTVYLAGGAVVRGNILFDGVKNARLLGRGLLDQETGRVRIDHSENIEVRGIFARQVFTGSSRSVTIANVMCISYGAWGDGMNVVAGHDVLIEDVFNRNSDDCITVYATRGRNVGVSSRVTVRDSTLWADVAHPILVGTHGDPDIPRVIEDLRFENLDILDHMEMQIDYQGCLTINAGDDNLIRNVRFENIRVEDFRRGQLVNLRVFYNRKYNHAPGRGIENVFFKDIIYTGTRAELSLISGYDAKRKVSGVVFENLVVNGVAISDAMPKPGWFRTADLARIHVGDHVDGLEFRPSPGNPAVEPVETVQPPR